MEPIYAMSLSAGESTLGVSMSAHLCVRDDSRLTSVTMTWPVESIKTKGMEAPAWLYRVLSHLVENFDNHDITHIEVDTNEDQEVKNNA
jgi:hypothetical protein